MLVEIWMCALEIVRLRYPAKCLGTAVGVWTCKMLIARYRVAEDRLHGDNTPVPVLPRGKTATGRAWVTRVRRACPDRNGCRAC